MFGADLQHHPRASLRILVSNFDVLAVNLIMDAAARSFFESSYFAVAGRFVAIEKIRNLTFLPQVQANLLINLATKVRSSFLVLSRFILMVHPSVSLVSCP